MAEKNFSQIPRPLREQYEKGKTALDRKNFDYAIAIFTQLLDQEPAFWDCRQALRVAQVRKQGAAGSSFFKKMLGGAGAQPQLAKGQVNMLRNPADAMKNAEQVLNTDPQNVAAHKLLAQAAMACELPKTAVMSLQIAVKHAPKDEEAQIELARAYAAGGEGAKAEELFAEIMARHPNDPRLAEELKNLSARNTLNSGGYEALSSGEGSYRDILKDKTQAVALEQESRQVKSEDVAAKLLLDYEAQAAKDPKNLKLLRNIAELHATRNDFDRALEAYNKIIAQEGASDASLLKEISETQMKKFDYALEQLNAQAPDYAEKSAAIKAQRDEFILTDTRQRVDRYPNDLQIRFELGELLFQHGKYAEAGVEFQKAMANPNKRISAMMYLGQCFAQRGMNDMAVRRLQDARKEKVVFDDETKEIIYALGTVLEKMGKKEEAIEQFKQIYEVDMGFKDVGPKVDAYYSGQK